MYNTRTNIAVRHTHRSHPRPPAAWLRRSPTPGYGCAPASRTRASGGWGWRSSSPRRRVAATAVGGGAVTATHSPASRSPPAPEHQRSSQTSPRYGFWVRLTHRPIYSSPTQPPPPGANERPRNTAPFTLDFISCASSVSHILVSLHTYIRAPELRWRRRGVARGPGPQHLAGAHTRSRQSST